MIYPRDSDLDHPDDVQNAAICSSSLLQYPPSILVLLCLHHSSLHPLLLIHHAYRSVGTKKSATNDNDGGSFCWAIMALLLTIKVLVDGTTAFFDIVPAVSRHRKLMISML